LLWFPAEAWLLADAGINPYEASKIIIPRTSRENIRIFI
jgi:hypothetical protein